MAIEPPHYSRPPPRHDNHHHNDNDFLRMKKSSDSLSPPSPRPEFEGRSSFCSVREHDSDLAQTFSSSKVSSYLKHAEAILDDSSSSSSSVSPSPAPSVSLHLPTSSTSTVASSTGTPPPRAAPSPAAPVGDVTPQLQYHPPLTNPHSQLHGYFYPVDSFRGWKQINVRGKAASRSYGDLQVLNMTWKSPPMQSRERKKFGPGDSPLENLPFELLSPIVDLLVVDIPTHGVSARNIDLMSLLLTSRTMHAATLNTLYNHVTIPHSRIFRKFLTHIATHRALGTIVRRLDFCHFNPSTIFSTAKERAAAHNLTPDTLLRCLELTPYLQEFLAQEYLDDDLDAAVLGKLFFDLLRLQAVDFCGCTSPKFKGAFQAILRSERWPAVLPVARLSFHKCISLPPSVYETVLPRAHQLTHLDVAGTHITDAALLSIPPTAKLTHLNLAKCSRLSARGVIEFLGSHPAARTLVFLSLGTDARSNQLLDSGDVTELLPLLPGTLKSLTLKGCKMEAGHIGLLRPLTRHLEELALGRCLRIQDINRLFVPDEPGSEGEESDGDAMDVDWVPPTLRYLDVSDMGPGDIDFNFLFGGRCGVLRKVSRPLEVIEVSDLMLERLRTSSAVVERAGWTAKEFGSRSWVVRHADEMKGRGEGDDGRREWKWGASFWGMRKVPVARADVGGMYGSFMFGRKL